MPSRSRPTKKRPPARRAAPTKAVQETARRRREKRSFRRRLLAVAALLVVAGAVLFVAARGGDEGPVEGTFSGDCREDSRHDPEPGPRALHVPAPTYRVDPPAGGAHESRAAAPGYYKPGEAPPDGQLVHAMEHGFVVLWYRPGLPPDQQRRIDELSDRFGRDLIVVPRPALSTPVAVTAWHRRLLCSAVDSEHIAAFTEARRDKGPEKGFL